jgi:hypothetical protein
VAVADNWYPRIWLGPVVELKLIAEGPSRPVKLYAEFFGLGRHVRLCFCKPFLHHHEPTTGSGGRRFTRVVGMSVCDDDQIAGRTLRNVLRGPSHALTHWPTRSARPFHLVRFHNWDLGWETNPPTLERLAPSMLFADSDSTNIEW